MDEVLFNKNESGLIPKITNFGRKFTRYLKETIDKTILPTLIGSNDHSGDKSGLKSGDGNSEEQVYYDFAALARSRKRKTSLNEIDDFTNRFRNMHYPYFYFNLLIY